MNPIEIVKGWLAERAASKSTVTPEQQAALDYLDNQPLREEWLEYCKHWAQARVWGKTCTPFKAFGVWHAAVLAAYGPQVEIMMDHDGCRLSNGQFYPYPAE